MRPRSLPFRALAAHKERDMPEDTLCKTIHQYNKEPVSDGDMKKLLEIAADYGRVKNYVYDRFGGIGSLKKLYPGYTVQNEMTASGLREQLDMPSVYFYLAVFDALKDIKSQWTRTKSRVLKLIGRNENLTPGDKHYLRFLLKINNAFTAVLNQEVVEGLPGDIQRQYGELAKNTDRERMHRYLCRQVRKYHVKPHVDAAEGFAASERAYRYADHGIYLSIKEKRKRIFIPLTDNNQYRTQIYIKLHPQQRNIEIKVPVKVAVRTHADYTHQVGLSVGMYTMFTTDQGHEYGTELGSYQVDYAQWIREQLGSYHRNKENNPGRKKYRAKKKRYEERLHSYVNQELNRLLRTEKPQAVYLPKLPGTQSGGVNRKINNSASLWQRGYIRRRLIQKCREQSVMLVEVIGKDISKECSSCGAEGIKRDGFFTCPVCGYRIEEKVNAAKNAKKRGMNGRPPEYGSFGQKPG